MIILTLNPPINSFQIKTETSYLGVAKFKDLVIIESNTYILTADGIGVVLSQSSEFFIDISSFSWDVSVNELNILSISFDKMLDVILEESDFQISLSNSINYGFSFSHITNSSYKLSITSDETILPETQITLDVLKNNLRSNDSYYFDYSSKTLNLFYVYKAFESYQAIGSAINNSKPFVQATASSAVLSGVVNKPSKLWSVMSCTDLIAYLPLSSVNYSDNLNLFFASFGSLQVFPNPFQYILTISNASEPYYQASKYGFETSYILYNSGILLSNFILSVSLIPVFYISQKVTKNRVGIWCKKMLGKYKFSYFLRFAIEAYLDLGLLALIEIKSVIFI